MFNGKVIKTNKCSENPRYESNNLAWYYTLKTSMLVEDGDSFYKYVQRVSLPESYFVGLFNEE